MEVAHLRDLQPVVTLSAGSSFSRRMLKFSHQQLCFQLLLLSGCYSLTGKEKAASIQLLSGLYLGR